MSAIFISYTGRDPEGDAWADRLAEWFREWNYGFFRDKDHSHGIKGGDDWRATLYRELGMATAMVSLCTMKYDSSPWCVGEVAISVEKGKTVIPIQLAQTEEELKAAPLPLLLQTAQVIKVAFSSDPSPEQLKEVKQRLREKLKEKLNWRALQQWDAGWKAYPGLPAFQEWQAPVFFGRDQMIQSVVERLASLALRTPAFLLLLGSSGYGKSSLVRAGVVPYLRGDSDRGWTVLDPFTPGAFPFGRLRKALNAATARLVEIAPPREIAGDEKDLLRQIQWLHSEDQFPVVLVIDQFEELLSAPGGNESQHGECVRFLKFLQDLLSSRTSGLVVLATMRTDFLAPLQSTWPKLTALASKKTLEPIALEDFGELISGPAERSRLTLQPGLLERLVNDSGGKDALPLLAFTLEKMWEQYQMRGGPATGPRGERWDMTVADYERLGGVEGSVSLRARDCWDPIVSPEEEKVALREAFLDHLLTVGDDGRVAKRPAQLDALPEASRPILQRLVDDRLLVSDAGEVAIAHEALLRTWNPLVEWIEEGREELRQRLRVKRLYSDLQASQSEVSRSFAIQELARMASIDGDICERNAIKRVPTKNLFSFIKSDFLADEERINAVNLLGRIRTPETLLYLKELLHIKNQSFLVRCKAIEAILKRTQFISGLGIKSEQNWDNLSDLLFQLLKNNNNASYIVSSNNWLEINDKLGIIQAASRGLQLAIPRIPNSCVGSDRTQKVPMLSLMAFKHGNHTQVHARIVETNVWMIPLPSNLRLEMVVVPSGTYTIGSHSHNRTYQSYDGVKFIEGYKDSDFEAIRKVKLKSFAISRYPVTQEQWGAVARLFSCLNSWVRPTAFKKPASFENPVSPKFVDQSQRNHLMDKLPVNNVSWDECQEWLKHLNRWLANEWPKYQISEKSPHLTLPSESQWEVACRAGSATPFHFGDLIHMNWANFGENYKHNCGPHRLALRGSLPVGFSGIVNQWGLADMHGQLSEWCADLWCPNPVSECNSANPQASKIKDVELGRLRPIRGGSWASDLHRCRSAYRPACPQDIADHAIGFRLCCSVLNCEDPC
jgi:formylglycine-generating enzyme required for sulfatase activity